MSPTQRTLSYFRAQGYGSVAVTEHWNPFAKIRQDLFGIIDLVVLRQRILGVQCTSAANHSARVKKVLASDHILNWVKCADFQVISWKKGAKTPRITHIFYDNIDDNVAYYDKPDRPKI